jgi:hypothetical protein
VPYTPCFLQQKTRKLKKVYLPDTLQTAVKALISGFPGLVSYQTLVTCQNTVCLMEHYGLYLLFTECSIFSFKQWRYNKNMAGLCGPAIFNESFR